MTHTLQTVLPVSVLILRPTYDQPLQIFPSIFAPAVSVPDHPKMQISAIGCTPGMEVRAPHLGLSLSGQ